MVSRAVRYLITSLLLVTGCATELPVAPDQPQPDKAIAFGRTMALLTGETSRSYLPRVRFIEIMSRRTLERYSIEIDSDDKMFILQLQPGEYVFTRVQIGEGPFMSMADYDSSFEVGRESLTYLGTWRFGIDSPRYGRMIVLSVVRDQQEEAAAQQALFKQYPELDGQKMTLALPSPNEAQTRLYEVMPYPRYPTYFRRQWW